jgi:hypothetical protein
MCEPVAAAASSAEPLVTVHGGPAWPCWKEYVAVAGLPWRRAIIEVARRMGPQGR